MKKIGIKKALIFWGVLAILVVCAKWVLILYDPRHFVISPTVFLLGIALIWIGVSLACNINPYFAGKCKRKYELIYSALIAGIGIAWIFSSFLGVSSLFTWEIVVAIPFLVVGYVIYRKAKKESQAANN